MSIGGQALENCSEEVRQFSRQWLRKFAKSYPPYYFVTQYADIMKNCGQNTPEGHFGRRFAQILSLESDRDINNQLRLIELEKDLIPLVESTENKIFYRNLFFPSVFINNDFYFEGLIIKGIYITECYIEHGYSDYALHHPLPNDYAIFVVSADIDSGCEFYANFAFIDKVIGENFTDSKEEDKKMRRLSEHVRILICNIIDMVEGNDKDLEIVTIETKREQNLKRIKKGQIAIPTKVFIKAKGHFKRYVRKFAADKDENKDKDKKIGYKFLVMGHWRHFRDEKFKNVKGTKIWIKPFWKGEGIAIAKDYIVIKS